MSSVNTAANRAVFEAMSRSDLAASTAIHSAECVYYGFGPQPLDLAGYQQFLAGYFAAFPDLRFSIEDELEDGDKVVTRYTAHGTQRGALMGIPLTGRPIEVTGISITHMVDGKTRTLWNNLDNLTMLIQLGVVPAPGQPAAR